MKITTCLHVAGLSLLFTFIYLVNPAIASDGSIEPMSRFAWSDTVGWVDFGVSGGNIRITDSELSGYAWGENIGWISLNCSNDGSCGTVDYGVKNDGRGGLSGYAWSESAGWIRFDAQHGGVVIDGNGNFSGYAWGENIGWISLNCSNDGSCGTVEYGVATDWRPTVSLPMCVSWVYTDWSDCADGQMTRRIKSATPAGCSGGKPALTMECEGGATLLPNANLPPAPPVEGYVLVINDGSSMTTSSVVRLALVGGSEAVRMSISNTADFSGAIQENFQSLKTWKLDDGDGLKMVYAKFYNQWGVSSPVVSAAITLASSGQSSVISGFSQSIVSSGVIYSTSSDLVTTGTVSGLRFNRDLKFGDKGEEVRLLQRLLSSLGEGIYPEKIVSGYFGRMTTLAVRRFQEKYSSEILKPLRLKRGTGNVGSNTREKLNTLMLSLKI